MVSILITIVIVFTWKPYKSEIVNTDDGNPNKYENNRMTFLFESGFKANDLFFAVGSDTLVDQKIWTDPSNEMATDFMSVAVQKGNKFKLKVDGQVFEGNLDLHFNTVIIRRKKDFIEFYYTNEKWLLYD